MQCATVIHASCIGMDLSGLLHAWSLSLEFRAAEPSSQCLTSICLDFLSARLRKHQAQT